MFATSPRHTLCYCERLIPTPGAPPEKDRAGERSLHVQDGSRRPPPGYVDLRKYTQVLRRSKWLIFLMVVLMAGLAGANSYTKQSQYTASAKVSVLPTGLPLSEAVTVGFGKILSMPNEAETVSS